MQTPFSPQASWRSLHLRAAANGIACLEFAETHHQFSTLAAATAEKPKNYYQLLDVDELATTKEIKAAFRKQAKECHPDVLHAEKFSDEEMAERTERFQKLNEAFSILTSEILRKQYDRKLAEENPVEYSQLQPQRAAQEEDTGLSAAEASARGSAFIEKNTQQISQWYVGQQAMSKEQVFFYKRVEAHEKQQAMAEAAAARTRKAIKPLSRSRSLWKLAAPVVSVGAGAFMVYSFASSSN